MCDKPVVQLSKDKLLAMQSLGLISTSRYYGATVAGNIIAFNRHDMWGADYRPIFFDIPDAYGNYLMIRNEQFISAFNESRGVTYIKCAYSTHGYRGRGRIYHTLTFKLSDLDMYLRSLGCKCRTRESLHKRAAGNVR